MRFGVLGPLEVSGQLLLGPVSAEERRHRVVKAVTENPGKYSKTSLIESTST